VKRMKSTAFNARKLAESVEIRQKMVEDKSCVKFLGLSGAMIPAGMRGCITEMINSGWVDVIVSTGANATHDIAQSFGEEYLQIDPSKADDMELRKKGLDRIHDLVSPAMTMETMEKNVQSILKGMKEGEYSTSELMEEIGSKLKDKNSFVKAASEKGVKVIIPALTDSILGIQTWMHTQDHKFKISEMKDLGYLINLNFDLKRDGKNSGALILGGGVPKNFILQSVLVADKPHKYVVQVTTDIADFGGLSGATLSEAKSWGKVNDESMLCTVNCDATIAFPIITSCLKEIF
jgi:deoxyhypusine synthase